MGIIATHIEDLKDIGVANDCRDDESAMREAYNGWL